MYQYQTHQYLNFRKLERADLAEVLLIERATYPFPWTEGIFKDCINSDYQCIAITLHDELIAYLIVSVVLDEAHLLNVCVHSQWRQQGLGGAAMSWLFAFLQTKNIEALFLEVRPSNKAASALYRRLGFEEIGLRKDYYPSELIHGKKGREDALVMRKSLSSGHQ